MSPIERSVTEPERREEPVRVEPSPPLEAAPPVEVTEPFRAFEPPAPRDDPRPLPPRDDPLAGAELRVLPPPPVEPPQVPPAEPRRAAVEAAPQPVQVIAARGDSGNQPPGYPPRARRAGLEGLVRVEILVGADGAVRDVRFLQRSGHRLLDAAVERAVRAWSFTPAQRGGRAVAWRFRYEFDFVLHGGVRGGPAGGADGERE